jgi:hypothetical protein
MLHQEHEYGSKERFLGWWICPKFSRKPTKPNQKSERKTTKKNSAEKD